MTSRNSVGDSSGAGRHQAASHVRAGNGGPGRPEPLSRRNFAAVLGAGAIAPAGGKPLPNILWITCEDAGPHLGCYGDRYADTPNLDRLAARGLLYRNVWSTAPVCAPARTAIISGLYPSSTGSEHMRSVTRLPAGMKMYPQFLREAGYYTSNNLKEDYNLEKPGTVWDESSKQAHWRNRKPDQPFFSVFNLEITHESQIRRRPHTLAHDPSRVRVPAYHPDTPEVRHDWAQYYDNLTAMDRQAGSILRQLEADGLADSTIVFFYADHGPGMPRSKRWPYNSGLHVPLLVHIPDRFRHLAPKDYAPGGRTDRLAGFVDLAPTVLSLAGIRPPEWMQGRAFLGEFQASEPVFLHGLRGRMDERCDMVRSVRDRRYVYIRNYMPHLIYGQRIDYMFQMPTARVWKELYDQGKLKPPETLFWEKKPPEELYDLANDRDEVNNLARSPAHRGILDRMRKALRAHALAIRDAGFLPEDEIHTRSEGSTPYEVCHDRGRYPLERIIEAAELASSGEPDGTAALIRLSADPDSAVRYWALTGLLARGASTVQAERRTLVEALGDPAPSVRATAARALGQYGVQEDLQRSVSVLLDLARLDRHGLYVALLALNALDALGDRVRPWKDDIRALPTADPTLDPKLREYVPRLIAAITEKLK